MKILCPSCKTLLDIAGLFFSDSQFATQPITICYHCRHKFEPKQEHQDAATTWSNEHDTSQR